MKKRNLVLIFGCLFLIALPGKAQVTIGSDAKPLDGALLQLKTNESTAANANGGFLLPRVDLASINDLSKITGMTAANQASYKGLMIYNIGVAAPSTVPAGTYVWTGDKWHLLDNSDAFSLTANNGLVYSGGVLKLGGALTEASTAIVADNKDLVFDLRNFDPIDRNKGFLIKGLKEQANSIAIVADEQTGRIGLSEVIPARLAFIQSGDETSNPADINTPGVGFWTVPWNSLDVSNGGDVVTNNGVVEFDPVENSWVMKMNAMVEISGMIGYKGGKAAGTVVINSTIQIKRLNGIDSGVWKDYSSVRGVYPDNINAYRNTLNIPPAMADLKVGDEIRLILARAPGTGAGTENGFLGNNHLTGDTTVPLNTNGIVVPYGTQFSKMLKIIVQ